MKCGTLLSLVVGVVAKQPHVVFVLVDDMGYNDFYTSSDIGAAWTSVNRLAESECLLIEHFYTQPICTPTRGAIMSGRSPIRLGLQHNVIGPAQRYGLPLDEITLPQKLQSVGYNTVGIGKWHLGLYNNASLPTRRGFNHWYGMWQGGESHFTHVFPPVKIAGHYAGVLDLTNDERVDRGQSGVYSADLFGAQAVKHIAAHKKSKPGQPLFLYLAMQNVHNPLEVPDHYTTKPPCADIKNADRKTFCGMAVAVDQAIGNVSSAMKRSFPDEDVLLFVLGDNGGFPGAAGNNCNENGICLRGFKGTLWEGGIRNNGLVCSPTMLPPSVKGQVYSKGLVHVRDFHATIVELAGAKDVKSKPLDAYNIWTSLIKNNESPRKEFLANIDPCFANSRAGIGRDCHGVGAAYRYQGCLGSSSVCGDWKLISGASFNGTWYHLPTSALNNPFPVTQDSSGGICFDRSPDSPDPLEVAFLQEIGQSFGQGAPRISNFPIPSVLPNSTRLLFNISADPEERSDLAAKFPQVVSALQDKIDALAAEALAPCNIPGGSCVKQDLGGILKAIANRQWLPWISDNTDIPHTIAV